MNEVRIYTRSFEQRVRSWPALFMSHFDLLMDQKADPVTAAAAALELSAIVLRPDLGVRVERLPDQLAVGEETVKRSSLDAPATG